MTDLQLGLLVIGAAAVAGVLVYNRVQERSVRRQAEQAFGSRHEDALIREPGLAEPALEEPVARRPAPVAGASPDPRVDYVVRLEGASLGELRGGWAALEHRFARRAFLSEAEDGSVEAALQMASRNGVVSEAELLEFRAGVESLAAQHGATAAAPEMRPALEAAQALDRACAEVDVQIALHVLGIPEIDVPEGQPFQLARRADGITLLLDVPRTADLARSYEAMVRTARHTAAAHGGRLVDDNGTALDERALAAIGAQVEILRARLAALGVEPGSPLALRLFS
jgi:hypothetical protein